MFIFNLKIVYTSKEVKDRLTILLCFIQNLIILYPDIDHILTSIRHIYGRQPGTFGIGCINLRTGIIRIAEPFGIGPGWRQ
jgi:hypothetical protein